MPTELHDFKCGFGLLIKEHLELCKLLLFGQPNVVAEAFNLLLELGKRNKILLLEFNNLLLAIDIANLVESLGRDGIFDVEHRLHDEVTPLIFSIVGNGEIAVVLLVKAILGKQLFVEGLALLL